MVVRGVGERDWGENVRVLLLLTEYSISIDRPSSYSIVASSNNVQPTYQKYTQQNDHYMVWAEDQGSGMTLIIHARVQSSRKEILILLLLLLLLIIIREGQSHDLRGRVLFGVRDKKVLLSSSFLDLTLPISHGS